MFKHTTFIVLRDYFSYKFLTLKLNQMQGTIAMIDNRAQKYFFVQFSRHKRFITHLKNHNRGKMTRLKVEVEV